MKMQHIRDTGNKVTKTALFDSNLNFSTEAMHFHLLTNSWMTCFDDENDSIHLHQCYCPYSDDDDDDEEH